MNWKHIVAPDERWARVRLVGGPFHGTDVGFLLPDVQAPVQIVWSSWTPHGFDAWLYEWHGEAMAANGRTEALLFRPVRRVAADEIPPIVATSGETWAEGARLLVELYGVAPKDAYPGL